MLTCLLQAIGTRDAIAKCLYSALFDWIVLQVNQALVSKRDFSEHKVLDGSSVISEYKVLDGSSVISEHKVLDGSSIIFHC